MTEPFIIFVKELHPKFWWDTKYFSDVTDQYQLWKQ